MNGIEKIIAKLNADLQAELDAVRAETDEKCRLIIEDGKQAAQKEYDRLIAQGEKECELSVSHMSRTAQMESRKSILALKQEMVSRAFERAHEMLLDLPKDKYAQFLGRKAFEASTTGEETLFFNERDSQSVAQRVADEANRLLAQSNRPAKLTVGDETRPITGGFFLKQGDIEVNCSLELLCDQCRDELASEVAGILFE